MTHRVCQPIGSKGVPLIITSRRLPRQRRVHDDTQRVARRRPPPSLRQIDGPTRYVRPSLHCISECGAVHPSAGPAVAGPSCSLPQKERVEQCETVDSANGHHDSSGRYGGVSKKSPDSELEGRTIDGGFAMVQGEAEDGKGGGDAPRLNRRANQDRQRPIHMASAAHQP